MNYICYCFVNPIYNIILSGRHSEVNMFFCVPTAKNLVVSNQGTEVVTVPTSSFIREKANLYSQKFLQIEF